MITRVATIFSSFLYYVAIGAIVCAGTAGVLFSQSSPKSDSLQKQLSVTDSPLQRLDLLEELFDHWIYKNYDSAFVYAQQYHQLGQQMEDPKAISTGLTLMGWVHDYKSEFAQAKNYYQQALALRKKLGDQQLIANSLSNLGVMYYYASDFKQAADYYLKAIAIREAIGDSAGLGQSYNNMGVLMRNQGEYEKAIEYYQRAGEVKKAMDDEYAYLATLINIGTLYATLGDHNRALTYARDALQIAKAHNDRVSIGQLHLNIGAALTGLGTYQKAEQEIATGLKILRKVGEKGLAFEGQNMLIGNYLKADQPDKALKAVYTGKSMLDEATDLESQHEFYTLAADVFAQNRDYHNAYAYQIKESKLQDSLFRKSSRDAMLELETKYETEKKEQDLALMTTRNALNEAKASRAAAVRNYSLIFALLTVGALTFVYINYRKRKALSEKLAEQNEIIQENLDEKELLIKEIHHRVKNNLQIISSLLNIQSKQSADHTATSALQESKNRVQSMAMIHQRLYQNEDLTSVQMQDYIEQLAHVLIASYGMEEKIDLHLEVEDIELDVDTTIPLALILNELLTNAVKHAFSDLDFGRLLISLKEQDDQLHLQVKDNGKGMDHFSDAQDNSFGLHLVKTLSKKLEADFVLNSEQGVSVDLFINKYQKAS